MKGSLIFLIVTFLCLASSHVIYSDDLPPIFEDFDSTNITEANIACTIDIHTQTGSPQPVYIRPGTSQFFHPADRNGQIQMTANQSMELWCSGGWENFPFIAPNLITATCVSGQTFRYNNENFNFNDFRCSGWPSWTARRTTTGCFNGGILVDFGYQVTTRWLHVYTSCHDLVLETNWYTQYRLTPISDANQRSVTRPSWSQAGFFTSREVDTLYTRLRQRQTVATILEDQAAADIFIEETSEVFLARGHMAAMTDFIFATEQRSTFHFLNVAPQWQTFNNGDWVAIEMSTRSLAANRGLNLDVYTGTWGNGQLWNTAGSWRNIFLDWPAQRIQMPMIYYKILIDQATLSGVVFIGVNNPHLTLTDIQTLEYIICPDVSNQISYINWTRTNLRRGYSYACEVHEFTRVVPHIPAINNIRYRLLT